MSSIASSIAPLGANARTGKIKDVIEVERELGRVGEEIERMQGWLRYRSNRTELTTVTIAAREERDYVPPQAPTFTGRVATVWNGSIERLQKTGEQLAIAAVAVTPWRILIVPAACIARWQWKRIRVSRR